MAQDKAQTYVRCTKNQISGAVSVMDKRAMLIAEIDDMGCVAWLWRAEPGKRPRPVKDAATCLQDIDNLVAVGASRPEIEAWLRRQMEQPIG